MHNELISHQLTEIMLHYFNLKLLMEYAMTQEDVDKDTTGIPFQRLLNILPEDCAAAAREDISVPLCFICLLHLANEHNLRITDCSTMDDLRIFEG